MIDENGKRFAKDSKHQLEYVEEESYMFDFHKYLGIDIYILATISGVVQLSDSGLWSTITLSRIVIIMSKDNVEDYINKAVDPVWHKELQEHVAFFRQNRNNARLSITRPYTKLPWGK